MTVYTNLSSSSSHHTVSTVANALLSACLLFFRLLKLIRRIVLLLLPSHVSVSNGPMNLGLAHSFLLALSLETRHEKKILPEGCADRDVWFESPAVG